jgi:phosphoglycolate phosphatase-like HAD superfamily hydrolase
MIGQLTEWHGVVMETRAIQLVVFDMDGTIVNSMPDLRALAVQCMSEFYESFLPEELESLYDLTTGVPFLSQLHRIFSGHPQNVDCAAEYEKRHALMAHTFKIGKEVDQLIDGLRKHHIRTALVSSTADYILRDLMPQIEKLRFDYIGGYTTDHDKTDQILAARKRFDLHYDYTLYVGDSDVDAEFARKAMVRFLHTDHSLVAKQVRDVVRTHNRK